MTGKQALSEKELAEFWENFSGLDSDDEGDVSESDSIADPEFVADLLDDEDKECEKENKEASFHLQNRDLPSCSHKIHNPLTAKQSKKTVNKNIIWKQKSMELNDEQLRFHGNTKIDTDILELDTPYQFFSYFFCDEVFTKIVEETNLYSVQNKPERPPIFTETDIKQYIGIILYMSLVHMPNSRSFWSDDLRFAPVADVMPVNKFEKIRKYIHFNNNDTFLPRNQPGHDKLHKIRPIVDFLNQKFSSVALEQHLSIDEQMCSTKVKHHMKQYMPMKPHKWGFKLFVLAGVTGFAYKFEIYTGQDNFEPLDQEPNLGSTSNVVLRLARIIPRQKNYRLYHDNYYTSLPLMVYLAKEGIYTLGTIRRNRLPNCKLPTEADLKSCGRGTSLEYVTTVDGVDVSSTIWKDNKCVLLISSFAGKNPLTKVKRYDRREKKTIEVDCPNIIKEYNRHMGGVDLLDSLMGRYKIQLKSRKWYIRIFYHLLDLAMVNAWLLYKRVMQEKGKEESKILNQAKFRAEIAHYLCSLKAIALKRGRPSTLENQIEIKRKKGPTKHVPPKEVRTDQTSHWPVFGPNKMRCKYPNCKGFTHTKCEKCGVDLCLNKNNNCFKNFHNN